MINLDYLPYIYTIAHSVVLFILLFFVNKIFRKNIILISIGVFLSLLLLGVNLYISEKSKEQTYLRIQFLIKNINEYKNQYNKYPDDLSYLNDMNENYYSWCSKDSSKIIIGSGLCYYYIDNDGFILEVVGDYNDWSYNSRTQELEENIFNRWGL